MFCSCGSCFFICIVYCDEHVCLRQIKPFDIKLRLLVRTVVHVHASCLNLDSINGPMFTGRVLKDSFVFATTSRPL